MIRQRLTEWVEDVRSVVHVAGGGDGGTAAQVERLIARITAAIAASDAQELLAVALALAALATGATPPLEPKKGRAGFWK